MPIARDQLVPVGMTRLRARFAGYTNISDGLDEEILKMMKVATEQLESCLESPREKRELRLYQRSPPPFAVELPATLPRQASSAGQMRDSEQLLQTYREEDEDLNSLRRLFTELATTTRDAQGDDEYELDEIRWTDMATFFKGECERLRRGTNAFVCANGMVRRAKDRPFFGLMSDHCEKTIEMFHETCPVPNPAEGVMLSEALGIAPWAIAPYFQRKNLLSATLVKTESLLCFRDRSLREDLDEFEFQTYKVWKKYRRFKPVVDTRMD